MRLSFPFCRSTHVSAPSAASLPSLSFSSCASGHCGCCHPVPENSPTSCREGFCAVFLCLWPRAAVKDLAASRSQMGMWCQAQLCHSWKDARLRAKLCGHAAEFCFSAWESLGFLVFGMDWIGWKDRKSTVIWSHCTICSTWCVLVPSDVTCSIISNHFDPDSWLSRDITIDFFTPNIKPNTSHYMMNVTEPRSWEKGLKFVFVF